jgi:hypothetical protein
MEPVKRKRVAKLTKFPNSVLLKSRFLLHHPSNLPRKFKMGNYGNGTDVNGLLMYIRKKYSDVERVCCYFTF